MLIIYWSEQSFVAYTKDEIVDRGRDFNTMNYIIFSIVVDIDFPSMPKRDIFVNKLT